MVSISIDTSDKTREGKYVGRNYSDWTDEQVQQELERVGKLYDAAQTTYDAELSKQKALKTSMLDESQARGDSQQTRREIRAQANAIASDAMDPLGRELIALNALYIEVSNEVQARKTAPYEHLLD